MNDDYIVGNVLAIDGTKIIIIMRQNTNVFSHFYNGETYRGVTIGEYIGIIRGPYKIVARVEREYLSDKMKNEQDQTYSLNRFERHIEVVVIGSFNKQGFDMGIKYLPMIYNEVVLLSEQEISVIIGNGFNKDAETVCINLGNSVQQNIKTEIPINGVFNSHIGIFGNTGSGKSNTLAKLYTEVFNHNELDVTNKGTFVILDFNGEYTNEKLFLGDNSKKEVIELSTEETEKDKLRINPSDFWNKETLSILFSATEKTQQPFIQNMLDFYIENGDLTNEKIKEGIVLGYIHVFKDNNNKESLNIFKNVINSIFNFDKNSVIKNIPYYNSYWHNKNATYYDKSVKPTIYLSDIDISNSIDIFKNFINQTDEIINQISTIDKLVVLANLQLLYGLANNLIQYEHINPLISRIKSTKSFFEKTISVDKNDIDKPLTIISFKNCNPDAKKILPLLIAKQLYRHHTADSNKNGTIEKTCHLIIDEAHNILSEQSSKEAESFKDYRLDSFEQIIKEGRKFGFYLTIASQRPYDISPTIISQLHNYFIHRLVNDLDLKMIANSISTLDNLSKSRIPNLAPGQCIITGTAFELPLLIQVKKLDNDTSPNSSNADIVKLWMKEDDV